MTDHTKPAADMTLDELATAIRRLAHANPNLADALRPSAARFTRSITERLPDVPPDAMAAVLIHTAAWLTDAVTICRDEGTDAITAVNVIAIAGEQMHRKALRSAS
jgi:4-aminobutyrate aminotransferase-like enzyme